jgi:ABC-type multidrug transport system ATPase subunit
VDLTPVLLADSVSKAFGETRVLSAATLAAHAGAVTVVLGRNGAGKSTLLKIAAGWLAADHGIVRFRAETYLRPRLHRLAARGLFYLPARGILSPAFTLRAHLEAVERRFPDEARQVIVDRLEIGSLLDRAPASFSGGERRRAELAVALLRRPLCLLADEPLLGIAPKDIEVIGSVLRDLAADGCAVVATGHELPALLPLADEVLWVTSGTTYRLGSPAQAERDWHFRREYRGAAETDSRRSK